MSNLSFLFIPLVFYLSQGCEGNPISSERQIGNFDVLGKREVRQGALKDSPRFHHSWAFFSLPSLPKVGSFFTDDDETVRLLKKRVDTLEKAQKELLSLFQHTKEAGRSESCNGQRQMFSEELRSVKGKPRPESSDNSVKGAPGQTLKKGATQSDADIIKGDEMNGPTPAKKTHEESKAPTEVDEKRNEEKQERLVETTETAEMDNRREVTEKFNEGKTELINDAEKLEKPIVEGEDTQKSFAILSAAENYQQIGTKATGEAEDAAGSEEIKEDVEELKKTGETEKAEEFEKPEETVKTEETEKSGEIEKEEETEKAEEIEKGEEIEKAEETEKSGETEKGEETGKAEEIEKGEETGKTQGTEKEKGEEAEKAKGTEKIEETEKTNETEKTEATEKSEETEKAEDTENAAETKKANNTEKSEETNIANKEENKKLES